MTTPQPSPVPTNAELAAEMARLRASVARFMAERTPSEPPRPPSIAERMAARGWTPTPANPGHFPGPDSKGSVPAQERAAALGWEEAREHPAPAVARMAPQAAGAGATGGAS